MGHAWANGENVPDFNPLLVERRESIYHQQTEGLRKMYSRKKEGGMKCISKMTCCDTVIYSKKHVFGLPPFPGTELPKPLEITK